MDKKAMETALKSRQTETLALLYDKYELLPTDVFEHKHYKIIRREGIEKIIDAENIQYRLEPWHCDEVSCTIHGKFWTPSATIAAEDGAEKTTDEVYVETLGSSNRDNTPSSYFAELAEKRCLSRGVLKLIKAYRYAFMGEDEIDSRDEEFRKSKTKAASGGTRAVYQGR